MRRDLLHTYRNPYFFVITKQSRIGFARILAGGGGGVNGQTPYGVGGITAIISTRLPVSFFFLRMRLAVLHGAAATNQSTVSGHGLVRSVGEPNGGPSMVHSDSIWSAVCSSGAPHRQAAEGRRLQHPVTCSLMCMLLGLTWWKLIITELLAVVFIYLYMMI